MKEIRIVMVGFGNVAQALAQLLDKKQPVLREQYGFSTRIVAIATGHHGMALNSNGIEAEKAIGWLASGKPLTDLSLRPDLTTIPDLIRASGADVLFENSPVNHQSGQPAIEHLRAGLECGMHAITANKGAVVYGFDELTQLAKKMGRSFLFESSVMDGAPIFSLFRSSLPAIEVKSFHGILNSTTNYILELMEQGMTFDAAVQKSKEIGIAETDPCADIDGWDSAIKVAAIATVIMGITTSPDQVERTGIRNLSSAEVEQALNTGKRWKLVCSAIREEGKLIARVSPERVDIKSPLYSVNGTSSFVQFETDELPGLGILESDPNPQTTAYGLLADLINAVRHD